MEPHQWAIAYVILTVVVALVASKKGRSGWLVFLGLMVVPIPLIFLVSFLLGDSTGKAFLMWLAAFLCPVVTFIIVIMGKNAEEMAVTKGSFGDYKKCPFCAESVRREATKCRHCQSALTSPT